MPPDPLLAPLKKWAYDPPGGVFPYITYTVS